MSISKNDILIKLIKSIEADVPSDGFTDILMEQLQTNVELNLASDEEFSELINLPNSELPSSSFTESIIYKLEPKQALTNYQPIISKKAGWLFVMTMFLMVSLSLLINKNSYSNKSESSSFETLNNMITNFLESFTQESTLILLCLISLSVLLSIDYIYKKRYL